MEHSCDKRIAEISAEIKNIFLILNLIICHQILVGEKRERDHEKIEEEV